MYSVYNLEVCYLVILFEYRYDGSCFWEFLDNLAAKTKESR